MATNCTNASNKFVEFAEVHCHTSGVVCNIFISVKTIVVPIIFGSIAIVGVLGNSLVVFVIVRHKKMQRVINLLLLNLALADLLFLMICPPFTAYRLAHSWIFGDILCKMMHYLLNVTVYITAYTLILISVVRYMAIVYHEQMFHIGTKTNVGLTCIVTWWIMLVLNIPIIQSHGVRLINSSTYVCRIYNEYTGKSLYSTFFAFTYVLPLTLIGVLNFLTHRHITNQKDMKLVNIIKSKENKNKASRMLIIVVVIYTICWLPIHIDLLLFYFKPTLFESSDLYMTVSFLWNILAYSNSCLNPFIYNFTSKEFRDNFRKTFSCLHCVICRRRKLSDGNNHKKNCQRRPPLQKSCSTSV